MAFPCKVSPLEYLLHLNSFPLIVFAHCIRYQKVFKNSDIFRLKKNYNAQKCGVINFISLRHLTNFLKVTKRPKCFDALVCSSTL